MGINSILLWLQNIYNTLIGKLNTKIVDSSDNELTINIDGSINTKVTESCSVGIDQTTDGTTNRVVAKISQADGENLVQLTGSILAEQLTHADAVANVLTFSETISVIEIYHNEDTWQQFVVNGLTITVPAGGYRTPVGGTASAEVTIPAGVSCIVGRLV